MCVSVGWCNVWIVTESKLCEREYALGFKGTPIDTNTTMGEREKDKEREVIADNTMSRDDRRGGEVGGGQ